MTQELPRLLKFTRSVACALFGAVLICAPSAWASALTVQGKVFDTNGNVLKQVAVTLTRPSNVAGPFSSTVFSREDGSFAFAPLAQGGDTGAVTVEAHAVGYRQVAPTVGPAKLADVPATNSDVKLVLVLQPQTNHADTAPASAWLKQIPQSEPMKPLLVKTCVNCHAFPQPEAIKFIRSLPNGSTSAADIQERKANWLTMTKFMYYGFVLSMIDSGKSGSTGAPHPEIDMEKVLDDPGVARHFEPVSELLAKYMLPQHLDRVTYDYGAPSAVTPRTTIQEYTIPSPEFASTIHSAALFGEPMKLWVPDLSRGQIYLIDPLTGQSNTVKVPIAGQPG
ncbi:MAG: carboxypeptidase-like regulatory domain-containing protein, partial [Pseudomonadota bacterium]|nr:carboxypeptidase-like regulatory domain-containing protein [Pseudomonadota bacterium]